VTFNNSYFITKSI